MMLALGTRLLLLVGALTAFVADRLHRDQRGQTTMEWLGIALVIAVVLVALMGFRTEIAETLSDGIQGVLSRIFGDLQSGNG